MNMYDVITAAYNEWQEQPGNRRMAWLLNHTPCRDRLLSTIAKHLASAAQADEKANPLALANLPENIRRVLSHAYSTTDGLYLVRPLPPPYDTLTEPYNASLAALTAEGIALRNRLMGN